MNRRELARESLTPTALLTLSGLVAGGLGLAKGSEPLLKASVIALSIASVGGVAIALWEHVTEQAGERWWLPGIVRAFRRRRPGRQFWHGLVTHLPQGLLALLLLLRYLRARR